MGSYEHMVKFWNSKLKEDGFKDIERNGRLDEPFRYSNHDNFFQNRAEYEQYYRVIGLYINHVEIPSDYKKILEHFVECGSMPEAIALSGCNIKLSTIYAYLKRTFPTMLLYVNNMERYYGE